MPPVYETTDAYETTHAGFGMLARFGCSQARWPTAGYFRGGFKVIASG